MGIFFKFGKSSTKMNFYWEFLEIFWEILNKGRKRFMILRFFSSLAELHFACQFFSR